MRRSWSDADRASALAALEANGGNVSQTARQLGVPRQTLMEWRDGRVPDGVPEVRHHKKGDLADALEALAWKLVAGAEEKIATANLREAMTAAGIAIDKMRLLRDQSTAISEQRQNPQELRADLMADYRALGYDEDTACDLVERAFAGETV